jgi:DNA-binding transcriptional regulator GbsR (MarR family)
MKRNIAPTLNAVRQARRQISEEVKHDPKKLVEYYAKLQKQLESATRPESADGRRDEVLPAQTA